MAKLAAINEDRALSASVAKHARYVMLNYGETIRNGNEILAGADLEEGRGKPGYSDDGAAIAPNSENAYGCSASSLTDQIDQFTASAFHRLALLSPDLDRAGFGNYNENTCWVSTIRLSILPSNPKTFDRPVEFPADGAKVALESMPGEWPRPLTACPGYREPAGLPITLQLGRQIHGQLSAHSLSENGRPVEHCAFDDTLYTNADSSAQEYARRLLVEHGTIVLIPQKPLAVELTYSVSITARGQTYTWSFQTAARDVR
jgi:hypothetical protein